MFGSSKNAIKSPTNLLHDRPTGLERAKLERTDETRRATTVDDVFATTTAGNAPADLNIQKRGAYMPDKTKLLPESQDSAHLYIGAGVKLKGEVAGCDMMRVEGNFEGTAEARQIILCAGGSFVGTATIDEAEVEGSFEGTLSVRGRLFLRNKGHIAGNFSYGQLEIERGGEIDGQITPFEKKQVEEPRAEMSAKPLELTAAASKPGESSALRSPLPGQAVAQTLGKPAITARPAASQQQVNGSQPLNGHTPPAAAE